VNTTPRLDLTIGFDSAETAASIFQYSTWTITIKYNETLQIPVGPLMIDGEINFKRYLVRTQGCPGLPNADIVQELIVRGYIIHEVRYGNIDRE
jgi:hypothetical protein